MASHLADLEGQPCPAGCGNALVLCRCGGPHLICLGCGTAAGVCATTDCADRPGWDLGDCRYFARFHRLPDC